MNKYNLTCLWCCIMFTVFANKNGRVTITRTNIFVIPLITFFGPVGHHQVISEEYIVVIEGCFD
jgi:hypothetical protein